MGDCRFGVSPVNYPDPDPGHWSRLCRGSNSKKSETGPISLSHLGIVSENFAYILLLTRSKQKDCQMPFIIDRGYAEVQITEMDITHFRM